MIVNTCEMVYSYITNQKIVTIFLNKSPNCNPAITRLRIGTIHLWPSNAATIIAIIIIHALALKLSPNLRVYTRLCTTYIPPFCVVALALLLLVGSLLLTAERLSRIHTFTTLARSRSLRFHATQEQATRTRTA